MSTMDCTICGNKNLTKSEFNSYDCICCDAFYCGSNKMLCGINFQKNPTNDNYIAIGSEAIYIRKDYDTFKYYDIAPDYFLSSSFTDKERYDFLKKFIDNMIFV